MDEAFIRQPGARQLRASSHDLVWDFIVVSPSETSCYNQSIALQEPRNLNSVPTRKKEWTLTQESFDRLLAWLDPDREQAGKKYEEVRSRLVRGFSSHGCPVPEDLADEAINRVAKLLPEIEKTYVGEP